MFELRWTIVRGHPKSGDISVGYNAWQRLQFRAKPTNVDDPFDHKNDFGDWQDVLMATLATPPGDG
jgi:hypothetical protein